MDVILRFSLNDVINMIEESVSKKFEFSEKVEEDECHVDFDYDDMKFVVSVHPPKKWRIL